MTRTWTLPIHIVSFWTVRMRKSLRKTIAGDKSLGVTPGIGACCRGECLRSEDHVVVWIPEAVAIQLGARAGGSHGPVVNSSVSASSLSLPHLVAVSYTHLRAHETDSYLVF